METISSRLKGFADKKGLSMRQLEMSVGASNGAFSKKGDILSSWVSKIFYTYPDLSLEWLLTGAGTPIKGNTPSDISNLGGNTAHGEAIPPTQKGGNVQEFVQNVSKNVSPTLIKGNKKGFSEPFNSPQNPYLLSNSSITYNLGVPRVVTVNERGDENIVFVPAKARAGYLVGYGDPVFIQDLPTYRLPGLTNGTYRMFEAEGPSMAPNIVSGDRLIGQWVPSLSDIRENRVHIIVHRNGIVVKRLLNRVNERGRIVLKSDTINHRHDHPTYELDPSDIVEIWYCRLKLSSDFSEPTEIFHRIADLEADMLAVKSKLALK